MPLGFGDDDDAEQIILTKELVAELGLMKHEDVTLPEGYTHVGEGAFRDNLLVRHVHIPNGYVCVMGYAFAGCRNLAKVRLPYELEVLEPYSFLDAGANTELGYWEEEPPGPDEPYPPPKPHPAEGLRMEDIPGWEQCTWIKGVGYEREDLKNAGLEPWDENGNPIIPPRKTPEEVAAMQRNSSSNASRAAPTIGIHSLAGGMGMM